MARQKRHTVEQDFGLDDVDAFHAAKDTVLLDETATRGTRRRARTEDFSDEEVMGVSDASDDDSDDADADADAADDDEDDDDDDAEFFGKKDRLDGEDEDEDEDGAWGDSKRAYYGADQAEDDEAAKEIEEEALRLQKKHLQELQMDDYVDDEQEQEWIKAAKSHDLGDVLDKKQESAASLQNISSLDPKSRRKLINTSHPEFVPLSKELTKWKPLLDELSQRQGANDVAAVKFTALSAYLGAVTSYFALFISLTKENESFSMRDHPVMESILSAKELWRQADDLEEVDDDGEESDGESEEEDAQMEDVESLEANEEFDSVSEEELSQSEESEEDSDVELDIDISKPRVFQKVQAQDIEDFAEGEIADVDAEEKKKRKKTLRFYTSKIDQQEKKKDERYTGDLDIPYKERLFERQQRLIEEARKRGLKDNNGADLDDNDALDEDTRDAQHVNDGFEKSYYDTVKQSTEERKTKRKEAHHDAVKAAKEGKLAQLQENINSDGKRAVNYQILKNKGLTPHRKKENRNSRVKKRVKYDQAKKKLKSVRAVYSTPTGAYDGEKTGIKKGLSKSVKFK